MKFGLHRPFKRKTTRMDRSFVRFACEIDSTLTFIDRMSSFEGRIIDFSRGGMLFRPKLAYIMRQNDVPVCIALGSEELFGLIVATSPAGFSVRFEEPLDEDIFDELTADIRVAAQAAA